MDNKVLEHMPFDLEHHVQDLYTDVSECVQGVSCLENTPVNFQRTP
jgi:hypothetical protein